MTTTEEGGKIQGRLRYPTKGRRAKVWNSRLRASYLEVNATGFGRGEDAEGYDPNVPLKWDTLSISTICNLTLETFCSSL